MCSHGFSKYTLGNIGFNALKKKHQDIGQQQQQQQNSILD